MKKIISVRLNKSDLEILEKNIRILENDWLEKPTISETIKYANYVLNCELTGSVDKECFECTLKHFKERKT